MGAVPCWEKELVLPMVPGITQDRGHGREKRDASDLAGLRRRDVPAPHRFRDDDLTVLEVEVPPKSAPRSRRTDRQ
jgi:hypothetical protein